MKTLYKQLGSVLLEALIALIIVGIGIIAITKLQGTFVKGGGEAQARNIALQLAQQRVDDLRAYNVIDPSGVTSPTTLRGYSEIRDNAGSSIAWTTTTVGNSRYTVSWDVINYQLTNATFPATVIADDNTGDSAYKAVTMTITWTSAGGAAEQVRLQTYIAKINAYGELLLGGAISRPDGPQVHYNPGSAPDVIAIDTGGEAIETTLPEPALKTIAGEDYYYSQFETVTYANGYALREEEFININCSCEYDNVNYIGSAYPIGRIIWHPDPYGSTEEQEELTHYRNSFYHPPEDNHQFIFQTASGRADLVGDQIVKVIGESAVATSKQHPFCNICCRDHHDGKATFLAAQNNGAGGLSDDQITGAYACKPDTDFAAAGDTDGDRSHCADPWRPVSDYDATSGDHNHYTTAGALVTPGGSGDYLESCRLKRVNGNFYVFQDWHLHGSTYSAAARDAFTPGAVDNVLTAYRAYIGDYVKKVTVRAVNMPNTYFVNPATSYVWPGSLSPQITTHFIARGIYMDYLDSFTLTKLNEIIDTTTFFENAVFNEINLTRLTDWQSSCVNGTPSNEGGVSDSIVIGSSRLGGFVLKDTDGNPATAPVPVSSSCVTDYDIALAGGNVADINRGEVLYRNTAQFTLNASMNLSNTGIVGNSVNQYLVEHTASQYPTDQDKSYDTTQVKYSYAISGTVPVTTSCNVTVSGSITKGGSGTKKANGSNGLSISSTPPGTCNITGSDSAATYSCVLSANDGSNVIISGNHTNPASGAVSVDCSGSLTLTGPSFITTN
ncbi:MAG: hypothetical protein ACU837_12780 [Gammaproteobacteria bacterium]